jgi:hypothetical protein
MPNNSWYLLMLTSGVEISLKFVRFFRRWNVFPFLCCKELLIDVYQNDSYRHNLDAFLSSLFSTLGKQLQCSWIAHRQILVLPEDYHVCFYITTSTRTNRILRYYGEMWRSLSAFSLRRVCFVYASAWLVFRLRVQMLIGKLCRTCLYYTTNEM